MPVIQCIFASGSLPQFPVHFLDFGDFTKIVQFITLINKFIKLIFS